MSKLVLQRVGVGYQDRHCRVWAHRNGKALGRGTGMVRQSAERILQEEVTEAEAEEEIEGGRQGTLGTRYSWQRGRQAQRLSKPTLDLEHLEEPVSLLKLEGGRWSMQQPGQVLSGVGRIPTGT